jgi:hypothetical protein
MFEKTSKHEVNLLVTVIRRLLSSRSCMNHCPPLLLDSEHPRHRAHTKPPLICATNIVFEYPVKHLANYMVCIENSQPPVARLNSISGRHPRRGPVYQCCQPPVTYRQGSSRSVYFALTLDRRDRISNSGRQPKILVKSLYFSIFFPRLDNLPQYVVKHVARGPLYSGLSLGYGLTAYMSVSCGEPAYVPLPTVDKKALVSLPSSSRSLPWRASRSDCCSRERCAWRDNLSQDLACLHAHVIELLNRDCHPSDVHPHDDDLKAHLSLSGNPDSHSLPTVITRAMELQDSHFIFPLLPFNATLQVTKPSHSNGKLTFSPIHESPTCLPPNIRPRINHIAQLRPALALHTSQPLITLARTRSSARVKVRSRW